MAAWTAEPVIQVEMAESRVEIVAPEQADHAAAEPNAFRIAGRSVDEALGFGKFVDLLRLFGGCPERAGAFWSGGFASRALSKGGRAAGERGGRKEPDAAHQSAGNAKHTVETWFT